MKSILIAILSLLVTFSLLGNKWVPAYLITPDQDTLTGFLKYHEWKSNPSSISFKKLLSDKYVTEYTPLQIAKVFVEGRIYWGAVVEIEQSPYRAHYLTKAPDFIIQQDTSFLLTLIGGPKSLYLLKDAEGKDHFYIRSGNDFSLLLYKKYIDATNRVKEANTYKWQLSDYLEDCPAAVIQIREYSRISLDKLFREYYDCTSAVMETRNTAKLFNIKAGVIAGVASSKIDFKTDYIGYLDLTDFTPSLTPCVGLFADIFFSSGFDTRWSIYQSITYTSLRTDGEYLEVLSPEWTINHTTTMEFSYLKLMNLLHYRHPISKSRLILGVGVSNGSLLDETTSRIEHTVYQNTEHIFTQGVINDIRKHELGFIGKIGLHKGKFSFDLYYETSNGISTYKTLSSRINRYYILIGYAF